jgi:hypothetical protein
MDFNVFVFMEDFTTFLLSIGRFFNWFFAYHITVGNWIITPLTIFSVGGGAFFLAIIIRALIRAVSV